MTQQQPREIVNEVATQARDLIEKGNHRHLVIRRADGTQLVDVSLTVAAVIGALVFVMPWSWFIIGAASVYGIVSKLRVEVVRDTTDQDQVIEIKRPDNNAE
jgi:hypothetical protein